MASAEVLEAVLTKGRDKAISQAAVDERVLWVQQMRANFSPPATLAEDGSIRQDFFKPEKVVILDDKRWGAQEKELLYKGLEVYGIGKWREISEKLLPRWDDQNLRVKASRLMGSQSLARYIGWQGDRAAVDEEFRKNKALGESVGCWRGGYLVEDDAGSVRKALSAQEGQAS